MLRFASMLSGPRSVPSDTFKISSATRLIVNVYQPAEVYRVCSVSFICSPMIGLLGSCPASSTVKMVDGLLGASSASVSWLSSNRLRLNPDKTQFIWLDGRRLQLY